MNKIFKVFKEGFVDNNPTFVQFLGMCPTLAVTTSAINGLGMGLSATAVLVFSNLAISLLRKIIPQKIRIASYIVIIAGFVTIIDLLLQAYLPDLYEMMGVYLALIVVNCIILGRAEMFARKNGIVDSALDGLGMGIGFLLALLAMATIREVIGAGSFAGIEIPFMSDYKIPILTMAPGGFLVYGILIAIVNKIGVKKGNEKRKNFSCEGCPSARLCGKVSCSENTELVLDVKEEKEDEANGL